jgi:hypothetical protein
VGVPDDLDAHRPPHQLGGTITVPYPPEAPASGVHHLGDESVFWYRYLLTDEEIERAGGVGSGRRLLLHFGAVDYRATVWLGGLKLGEHEGGMTPFSFDITELVAAGHRQLDLRAVDEPSDVSQPRGKQDWRTPQHSIWYNRTSGIWQPVWLESVPTVHLMEVAAEPAREATAVDVRLEISGAPGEVTAGVEIRWEGAVIGATESLVSGGRQATLRVELDRQRNGQQWDELLWSPEQPRLLEVTAWVESGDSLDVVGSYAGLRLVHTGHRKFWLNRRPYYIRAVLEQGLWPDTHLAAPSGDALRAEVQRIKDLGFNTVRVHQKVEDPRFLYWADRLGLMVWGEMASTYEASDRATTSLLGEWAAVVRRDRMHPSIVVWVPLNESWGVQHVARRPEEQHLVAAIVHLTRSLDPSRPVISNDGWEHLDSDLWTIHDYADDPAEITRHYGSDTGLRALLDTVGAAGRLTALEPDRDRGQPFVLSEFGGVSFGDDLPADAWGYSRAESADDLACRIRGLVDAVRAAPLAGYCYTQLTDTGLETNGLLYADRQPKAEIAVLREIFAANPVL